MTALSPPPGFGVPLLRQSAQPHPPPLVGYPKQRSRGRRVSWAADEKLCQIRLFVAEDAPTMLGSAQEQLQAKQARNLHIFSDVVDDTPPGFGGMGPVKARTYQIAVAAIVPQIAWRPPSIAHLDPNWHVVAGAASLESGLQKQREVRMLEAVYPRPSAIPESPAEPAEQEEPYDDAKTPQIPLVPLEEEDLADGNEIPGISTSVRSVGPTSNQGGPGVQSTSPSNVLALPNSRLESGAHNNVGNVASSFLSHSSDAIGSSMIRPATAPAAPPAGPDLVTQLFRGGQTPSSVAASATAALAALSRSQEAGSTVDTELLARILQDPALLRSLAAQRPLTVAKSTTSELFPAAGLAPAPAPRETGDVDPLQAGVARGGNNWIVPPSTSYTPSSSSAATSGQDRTRPWASSSSAGPDDRHLVSMVGPVRSLHPQAATSGQDGNRSWAASSSAGMDDRHLASMVGPLRVSHSYADLVNGRVGLGQLSAPLEVGSSGFGTGGKAVPPPGFGSKPGQMGMGPPQPGGGPAARALSQMEYYKSLILQHGVDDDDHGKAGAVEPPKGFGRPGAPPVKRWFGGEELLLDGASKPDRRERPRDSERSSEPGAPRAKSRKVCIYFGTPRGCRNGDNCAFVHESQKKADNLERAGPSSAQVYYSKRLKVDG